MSDVAKQLQVVSFDGVAFACEGYSVSGGLDHNLHKYRHTPGAQVEKQGRRPYTFAFRNCKFSSEDPYHPNAFPTDVADLRLKFESETTAALVIPTLGEIQALCIDWPFDVDFRRMRDGETGNFTFIEDAASAFAFESSITVSTTGLSAKGYIIEDECEALGVDPSFLDSILAIANALDSYASQIEEAGASYIDQLTALISACQRVYDITDIFQHPENHRIGAALRDLSVAAGNVRQDILRLQTPVTEYTTPTLMSIVEVSMALYGHTKGANSLLKLNGLTNPMAIPPQTTLRAYATV